MRKGIHELRVGAVPKPLRLFVTKIPSNKAKT